MVPAPFPHVELESEGGHCGGAGIHTSGRSPLTPSGSGRCLCTAGGASNTQDPSLPAQLHRTAGPVPMAHADSTTSNRPGKVMRTRPRGLGRAQTDCLGRAAGTPLPGQRGPGSEPTHHQGRRIRISAGAASQGADCRAVGGQGLWGRVSGGWPGHQGEADPGARSKAAGGGGGKRAASPLRGRVCTTPPPPTALEWGHNLHRKKRAVHQRDAF